MAETQIVKKNAQAVLQKLAKKDDFVEIKFTGYAHGQIFDSNIPEDLKVLDPQEKTKPEKTIIAIGQQMLVPGLDKQLENKEIDKEYEITVPMKEAFGERKRDLIRVIPLKAFTEQKMNPSPGMMFTLDNSLVKVIAVSGARVTVDFNNPLAGKDLKYKIIMTRLVTNIKEKSETLFKLFLHFTPEFEVGEKITVKGPKILERAIDIYKDKFKELLGKELAFEEKKKDKEGKNLEEKITSSEKDEQKEGPESNSPSA